MANDTFYKIKGDQPFGYVGQDIDDIGGIPIETTNSIHKLNATKIVLQISSGIKSSKSFHSVFSTKVKLELNFTKSINSIHKLKSTLAITRLSFKPINSIHKQYFYDKWNARFTFDCSRYLDTPYQFRLMETPGCDICVDPSILPDDPLGSSPGTGIGIGGDHNSLTGLQGGVFEEYYHLTLAERNKLATMTQGSITFVSGSQPIALNSGDGWIDPTTKILSMYYNTIFNDVSVQHSTKADEVDGGYF